MAKCTKYIQCLVAIYNFIKRQNNPEDIFELDAEDRVINNDHDPVFHGPADSVSTNDVFLNRYFKI